MHISLRNRGIQVLDFSSHNSATAAPKDVIALQVIESLDASHNSIRSLVQLNVFTSLRTLQLSRNRLTSPVMEWVRALPEGLEDLDLSHNEISSIESVHGHRTSLGQCFGTYTPRLKKLNLSHNLLHASAAEELNQSAARHASTSCALTELVLDHNTGIFSLNELLTDLPSLELLSCRHNHIETLEAVAGVSVACPLLHRVSFEGCPVAERLQDDGFLWSIIGGSTFEYRDEHERRQAQRDMAKLADHFFAVLVAQVMPSVHAVDGVTVADAQDLVGPLIGGELDDVTQPRAAPQESEGNASHNTSVATSSNAARQHASHQNQSTASTSAPTVATTDAPHNASWRQKMPDDESCVSSTASASSGADHRPENDTQMGASDSPGSGASKHKGGPVLSASETARLFGNLMAPQAEQRSRSRVGPRTPQHVLDRVDYLQRRTLELQEFIVQSRKQTRYFEDGRQGLAAALNGARKVVKDQRSELAALKVERGSQCDVIRNLQHLIHKKTRELDHAEVANIRAVERKVSHMMQAKEEALRSHIASRTREQLRKQSISGVDAPASSRKPTRSSLQLLEASQKRIEQLKHTSPMARTMSKFVYNEYGNPELAGGLDAMDPGLRMTAADASQSPSPKASRALNFTANAPHEPLASYHVPSDQPPGDEGTSRRRSSSAAHRTQRTSQGDVLGDASMASTRVSLSPEPSSSRDRSRSMHEVRGRGSVSASPERVRSATMHAANYAAPHGMPPRSPKLSRRSEPDHHNTILTDRSDGDASRASMAGGNGDASSRMTSLTVNRDDNTADDSFLSGFRFTMDQALQAANGTRRASGATPRHVDVSDEVEDQAQTVVNRVLASVARRSTVTGHSAQGQLSHPLSTLEVDPSASDCSTGDGRERRLVRGTTGHEAMQHEMDGGTSIAIQSPKKRISESAAGDDGARRRPSSLILAEALREVHHGIEGATGDGVDASWRRESATGSRRQSAMDAEDGMCAVSRQMHHPVASRAYSTSTGGRHRYDMPELNMSLDGSISRSKPNFRRVTMH